MSNVSRNIKKLRLAAKMTQDELGERLHVTRQAVSNWENGRTQPDLEMLRNIANVFVTDEMELIYGKKSTVETLEAYPQNGGLSIVCILSYYGLFLLVFYGGGTLQLARFLWGFSVGLFINPEYIFSLIGITAFLGVNR